MSERRNQLVRARKELEETVNTLGKTFGFDMDNMNLQKYGLTINNPDGSLIYSEDDPEYPMYDRLGLLIQRLRTLVDKLEGPNRVF